MKEKLFHVTSDFLPTDIFLSFFLPPFYFLWKRKGRKRKKKKVGGGTYEKIRKSQQ